MAASHRKSNEANGRGEKFTAVTHALSWEGEAFVWLPNSLVGTDACCVITWRCRKHFHQPKKK